MFCSLVVNAVTTTIHPETLLVLKTDTLYPLNYTPTPSPRNRRPAFCLSDFHCSQSLSPAELHSRQQCSLLSYCGIRWPWGGSDLVCLFQSKKGFGWRTLGLLGSSSVSDSPATWCCTRTHPPPPARPPRQRGLVIRITKLPGAPPALPVALFVAATRSPHSATRTQVCQAHHLTRKETEAHTGQEPLVQGKAHCGGEN